ncbi:MAG: phycoerythrobilin:ferredoxin oxidoreductase [Cyanobacteria bacterium P01_C01_bin.89]
MTLYQPFLDHAIATLNERLDLQPYPIPAGYEKKEARVGSKTRAQTVTTSSYAVCSKKLRQIRAAHVQGGGLVQVLNFVIFPNLEYDLPFFGADLVTLPGGHLIAIDMQPLFGGSDGYRAKYADPVMETFQKYQADLPWGGDFPEEAKAFFSPAFLWTRPKENTAVETHVFNAFKDYLTLYLDFVDAAVEAPISDRPEIQEAHLRYLRYRAEKDPARGMFKRFYGEEWTEEYIHGFLFDLERQLTAA